MTHVEAALSLNCTAVSHRIVGGDLFLASIWVSTTQKHESRNQQSQPSDQTAGATLTWTAKIVAAAGALAKLNITASVGCNESGTQPRDPPQLCTKETLNTHQKQQHPMGPPLLLYPIVRAAKYEVRSGSTSTNQLAVQHQDSPPKAIWTTAAAAVQRQLLPFLRFSCKSRSCHLRKST